MQDGDQSEKDQNEQQQQQLANHSSDKQHVTSPSSFALDKLMKMACTYRTLAGNGIQVCWVAGKNVNHQTTASEK